MSKQTAFAALQSLTDEEADLLNNSPDLLEKFKQKHALEEPKPSLMRKGWNALAIPEQKSREGLQMMAKMVSPQQQVTGNLPRDIAMNLPRIGAETLAETAPGFISRGSLLTMGALKGVQAAKPLIKMAGRGLASGAEALSGLEHKTPGVLMEAAQNPKLIMAPARKAASAVYEAAKETGGGIRPALLKTPGKIDFVDKASKLADQGKLKPIEALEARKELDAIKRKVTGEFFRSTRGKFDLIAKADQNIKMADPMYAQGVKAEALRSFLPLNKTGGASTFKTMVGGALGGVPLAAMSPIVQGTAATGIGMAARTAAPLVNNPVATAGLIQAAKEIPGTFKLKPDVQALEKGQKIEAKPKKSESEGKTLTKEKAYEFVREAKGNKKKARRLAKDAGYTWEGDF